MVPLEMNQRVLRWLSGYPPRESDSRMRRLAYISFTLFIIMAHFLSAISSITFSSRNITVDLAVTLCSLFPIFGSSSMLFQSIVIIILRQKITAIFDGLAKIYDECKKYFFPTKLNTKFEII